jgi:hypothetical protein|tara:strand:- start:465 stop:767 length:303 start_codon:yes stop_codon:yes gene_type:complete
MSKAHFYLFIVLTLSSVCIASEKQEPALSYSIVKAVSGARILPDSKKSNFKLNRSTLSIKAAKNEYEPASFVISAGDVDVESILISVSNLYDNENELSSE